MKNQNNTKKSHQYEIIGTWMFNTIIESDKPREEMLDVYAPILHENKDNALFVKGECREIGYCTKCEKLVSINDSYCRHCGNKLD